MTTISNQMLEDNKNQLIDQNGVNVFLSAVWDSMETMKDEVWIHHKLL